MNVRIAHPRGYDLDEEVMTLARNQAAESHAELETNMDLKVASEDSHVIYARSWWSLETYGQASLAAHQSSRQGSWTVDDAVMDLGHDTRLMHAMPIRRNLEVTDKVLDSSRSLIIEQAANRLHTQKSLLSLLLRN